MGKAKKTGWKKWLGGLALAGACLLPVKANALSTANLNIDVTIGGSKSVTVNTSSGSVASTSTIVTYASANQMVVNTATAAVQNNSGILSEGWWLSTNATSIDQTGGAQTWSLATSTFPTLPGADSFAVQAVFGSSMTAASGCPASGATDWNGAFASPLTGSAVQYTNAVFADTGLNANGANTYKPDDGTSVMYASNGTTGAGNRALCYRAILPQSTTKTNAQIIQIIVTAN